MSTLTTMPGSGVPLRKLSVDSPTLRSALDVGESYFASVEKFFELYGLQTLGDGDFQQVVERLAENNGKIHEGTTNESDPTLTVYEKEVQWLLEDGFTKLGFAKDILDAADTKNTALQQQFQGVDLTNTFDPNRISKAVVDDLVNYHGATRETKNGKTGVAVTIKDNLGNVVSKVILEEWQPTKQEWHTGAGGPILTTVPDGPALYKIVASVAPTYGTIKALDFYVFDLAAQSRQANILGAATFVLHQIPFGAAADQVWEGDYYEAGLSLVDDTATLLGVGLAGKAGKFAKYVLAGSSMVADATIGTARLYGSAKSFVSGNTTAALGDFGEAALRLMGFGQQQIEFIKSQRKTTAATHASMVSTGQQRTTLSELEIQKVPTDHQGDIASQNLGGYNAMYQARHANRANLTTAQKGELAEDLAITRAQVQGYEVLPSHYTGSKGNEGENRGFDLVAVKETGDHVDVVQITETKYRDTTDLPYKPVLADEQILKDNLLSDCAAGQQLEVGDIISKLEIMHKNDQLRITGQAIYDNLDKLERKIFLLDGKGEIYEKILEPLSDNDVIFIKAALAQKQLYQ